MTLIYHKLALIFQLILAVNCDNVIPQNPLECQVLLLLKKWRVSHVNSDIMPLPSLRSIKIPDVDYYYEGKGIKITFILKKMELNGLESFTIKELTALETKNSLDMSISLNIPKLTLHSENYELKGRAYLVYPLKGSGNLTIIFRNIDLSFKIRFNPSENEMSTRIGDFRFDFNVHHVEANLTGSSWPVNKVLNSEGVEVLSSYHDEIVLAMREYIVPYVDHHLVNVTIAELIYSFLTIDL